MFAKSFYFFLNNSMIDFIRKCIITLNYHLRFKFYSKLRTLIFLKSFDVKIGHHVNFVGFAKNIVLGKNISIYDSCKFEFSEASTIHIGSNIIFSYGVIVSCRHSLQIGDNVQIGEYTSIRDATHNYKGENPIIMKNQDLIGEVIIGNNVWIGRNCLIGPGSVIEEGVVIGANSIVKGHLEKDCIYAGSPLRKIGTRK
jgi:acetyltransferase-like isoleucine patch superfamily enzyme